MLSKPSKKLVGRILSETDYDNRLEGWRLRRRSGMMRVNIYSVRELVAFLADPYPRIDLTRLKSWIGGVMEDHELAGCVEEIIRTDGSDHDKTCLVRNLVGYRFVQCEKYA